MLSPLPRRSDWDHSCSFTQPCQPSPKWRSGRPAQRPFRGLLSVHSRYGLHTRAATIFEARFTGGFNRFVTSTVAPVASGWSGCRVGLSPTGKAPPYHGARQLQTTFQTGVNAVFAIYSSRGMDIQMGDNLAASLTGVGYLVDTQIRKKRMVRGGSREAVYQSISANQLADSLGQCDIESIDSIKNFAQCLLDPELYYQSRTTVAVLATRPE